jgi:hypothetical protein
MTLPTPKYCPITGNQPISCTRKGFAASCAKFREHANRKWSGKANVPSSIQSDYCLICQGEVPGNVTFIDLPTETAVTPPLPWGHDVDDHHVPVPSTAGGHDGRLIVSPDKDADKDVDDHHVPVPSTAGGHDRCLIVSPDKKIKSTKENTMASSKKFSGKCQSCGGEKTLSMHFGKAVCNSCLAFRIGASKHPQMVLAALKEFGNLPGIPVDVPQSPGTEKELADLRGMLAREIEQNNKLNDENETLASNLEHVELSTDTIKKENALLKDQLRHAADELKQTEIIEMVKKILKVQANEDVLETVDRRMKTMAKLEDSYLEQSKDLYLAETDRDDAKKEVAALVNENEILIDQLRQAADELRNNPPVDATGSQVPPGNHNPTDSTILDIALDVIAGKITGIDADRLRRLRA